MTREERINLCLKDHNIPITSLEANSIIKGIKWADEHPNLYNDEKYHTVKVSCLDELYRKSALYDAFIEKACEWLEDCAVVDIEEFKKSNGGMIMKQYEVIFADLDGTLINTISGKTFPKGIWDMKLNFDALDAIKKINPKYILIVSNQGGIESGFVDENNFHAKLEYIARAISEYCNCECYAMYCETNTKTDLYRKPNTGMLENLLESYVGDDFDYIKQKSLMIGDASGKEGQFSDSDKKTAENFGIDYMDINDFIAGI